MQSKKTLKCWALIRKKEKIVQEIIADTREEAVLSDTLTEACRQFDVAVPVVLSKHRNELAQFRRVVFFPRDFLEPFPYTTLELTVFEEN